MFNAYHFQRVNLQTSQKHVSDEAAFFLVDNFGEDLSRISYEKNIFSRPLSFRVSVNIEGVQRAVDFATFSSNRFSQTRSNLIQCFLRWSR